MPALTGPPIEGVFGKLLSEVGRFRAKQSALIEINTDSKRGIRLCLPVKGDEWQGMTCATNSKAWTSCTHASAASLMK